MKLSRPIKLLVGAATLWLPLYMIAFFVLIGTRSMTFVDFDTLWNVHMATTLLSVGVLVFYVVHLFKVPLPTDQKLMWALTLFFLGPLAMPFYFFKHVWPEVN
jgi:hypothetical protein